MIGKDNFTDKIFTKSEMHKLARINLQQFKYEMTQHRNRVWFGKIDVNRQIFVTEHAQADLDDIDD